MGRCTKKAKVELEVIKKSLLQFKAYEAIKGVYLIFCETSKISDQVPVCLSTNSALIFQQYKLPPRIPG